MPPYNLGTRIVDVTLHPAKYVLPRALVLSRLLTVLGWLLLTSAVLAIVHLAMVQFLRLH